MPYKTCKCGEKNGVRSKKCKSCGDTFGTKGPSVPVEPGSWVLDQRKDLPKLHAPEPIPKGEKLTNEQLRHYIEYEGIGFCVWEYISHERIADPILAFNWKNAREALKQITHILYPE